MAVIKKTPSGKWELDYRRDGKRHRPVFQTKALAEQALLQLTLGVSSAPLSGQKFTPKTLKEAIHFYFEKKSEGKASKANERKYFERLYKSLRAQGASMVHEVTAVMIEEFQSARKAQVKPSTVNREFNTYRHFFAKCIDWEWAEKNPCQKVENLAEKKNPRRVWTDEEFKSVVANAQTWVADVLTVMYWTGAGPAEIARLTWADVDLERGVMVLKRYKGDGSERTRNAYLIGDLKDLVQLKWETARREFRAKPDDVVFVNSRRKPVQPRSLSQDVSRICERLGLPDGTVPYGLRHKFATELLEANVGEEKVRKLMGHGSVRTLIENYAHVRNEELAKVMDTRQEQAAKVTKLRAEGGDGR